MVFKNKIGIALLILSAASQAAAVEIITDKDTKFSFGGYIKAEGIINKPDQSNRTFEASMRQSRLNFAMDTVIQDHNLKAFMEIDFWDNLDKEDDASFAPRMRHAYLEIDKVTLGQTWSGQFFATAPMDVEILNMFGLGAGTLAGTGATVRPNLLVHYQHKGLRLTAQDPAWSEAAYPDMVISYTHRVNGHAFNLAVTGREVNTVNDESKFGAAVSLANKIQLGNTHLAFSAFTGQGAGVYAGWGYKGAAGAKQSTDVNQATGKLITTTGFSTGITQKFTANLRGTLRYGQVKSNHVEAHIANDTFKTVSANLIYTYLAGLDFGIEWRDQNAQNMRSTLGSAARLKGQQVEIMARYTF